MFDVILHQPEIPPNTGNIIRLCANTGARLNLIRPLGFDLTDRALKRAGLDYHEFAELRIFDSYAECVASLGDASVYAFSTRGTGNLPNAKFTASDALLFGSETAGLPTPVMDQIPIERRLRLPMVSGSRSLNLSNAVAVVVYEAWRQLGYAGGQ